MRKAVQRYRKLIAAEMTSPAFRVEPLVTTGDRVHDRARFRSGQAALDRYFQTQAAQDLRRRVANCFVAVEASTGQAAAFYTLSAASSLRRSAPRRIQAFTALSAVDERFQGAV